MNLRSLFGAALAGMLAAPAYAQSDPASSMAEACYAAPFELTAEQRTLLCDALVVRSPDPAMALERIDRAMSEISGPSAPHVLLSAMRASVLMDLDREEEGLEAFAMALLRYPDAPPILSAAIYNLTYTAHADKAADSWIRLAEVDPQWARSIPGYMYEHITERLAASGDHRRTSRLAQALDAIGYTADTPAGASSIARRLVADAIEQGDLSAAREALRDVRDPSAMISVLVDEDYRELWPDIPFTRENAREPILRAWIGALGEAAQRDRSIGGRVIGSLVSHLGPRPVIEAYGPQVRAALSDAHDPRGLFDYAYWVAPLARAHLIEGDEAAAEALYRRAVEVLSKLDSVARFNADANLALMLVDVGRPAEALEVIDETIAALQALDPANTALLPMHAVRVRSLFELDRPAEASSSLERLRAGAGNNSRLYVSTMLLIGRYDEARDALVGQLGRTEGYADAVELLQPSLAAHRTAAAIRLDNLIARLATEPAVLSALEGKGRVLDLRPIRFEHFDLPDLDES